MMNLGSIRDIHPWLQPLPDKRNNTKDSEPKWTSSDGDFVRVLKEPLKDPFPFSFFNMIQMQGNS
jgi:hypothetical protein